MDGMEVLSLEMPKLTLMFNLREEYMRERMELNLLIMKLLNQTMDMDSILNSELLLPRKEMVPEIYKLDLTSPTGFSKTPLMLINLM
jgi:hypothetical protein